MPSKLPWEKLKAAWAEANDPGGFQKIAEAAGGFDNLGTVVDERRRGTHTAPSVAAVPEADLSKLDRYAHGGSAYKMMPPVFRDTPIAPLAVGVLGTASEALKFLPQDAGNALASVTDPTYAHDSTTSKPSLGNILNLLRGYGDAQAQGQASLVKKLFNR